MQQQQTVALYNVAFRRPDQKPKRIACVKAVRAVYAGNWFPAVAEIMTPDKQAISEALPHYWRPAFHRATANGSLWHTEGTLHASVTLYGSRGKTLGTVLCDGYEYGEA